MAFKHKPANIIVPDERQVLLRNLKMGNAFLKVGTDHLYIVTRNWGFCKAARAEAMDVKTGEIYTFGDPEYVVVPVNLTITVNRDG